MSHQTNLTTMFTKMHKAKQNKQDSRLEAGDEENYDRVLEEMHQEATKRPIEHIKSSRTIPEFPTNSQGKVEK